MYDSIDVARAAVKLAVTSTRSAEEQMILRLKERDIFGAAVDVGGDVVNSIHIIIERAILASRKNSVTKECHVEDGAIAGATREALTQIIAKATGLNGGGKIAICRHKEHLSVCVFMSIGLLHLNEVVIGLGHRSLPGN
ncbi:HutP family protein [Sinanaerobacter sp. ZZT-01]|uniref:HutP family protein n=1 Tax=Sinanaerobacter sp. ZZT-01 TaxID=3111540 RepID=UPI002D794828|nr:HutP family protein [Sinanaerobacter sp. ZZT-01]WRR92543.1 HutP family protein [Sinanaerobacter sp. ZZT-01]